MRIRNACSKHIEFITPKEMNLVLAEQDSKMIKFGNYDVMKKDMRLPLSIGGGDCIIQDSDVAFACTTLWKGTTTTFICYKDGRDPEEGKTGLQIFNEFSRYWTVPRKNVDISASPILGYNPDYEWQRIEAWSYDLNSAYSDAMMRGWIDVSRDPIAKEIEPETEIGFDFDDDTGYLVLKRCGYCMHTFKKCEVPDGVRKYVRKWYDIKRQASAKGDYATKIMAKQHLNYIVGYFQRVNPWLRAWVVCSCNEYIEELLDENSLYWNTDSICSRARRPDLEENLGTELGQWKMDHQGVVAYRGLAYQWNMEKPTYRGVVKSWFPDGWDILKDEVPSSANEWVFNKKTLRLEANKWREQLINM